MQLHTLPYFFKLDCVIGQLVAQLFHGQAFVIPSLFQFKV